MHTSYGNVDVNITVTCAVPGHTYCNIALYHHDLQQFNSSVVPCQVTDDQLTPFPPERLARLCKVWVASCWAAKKQCTATMNLCPSFHSQVCRPMVLTLCYTATYAPATCNNEPMYTGCAYGVYYLSLQGKVSMPRYLGCPCFAGMS